MMTDNVWIRLMAYNPNPNHLFYDPILSRVSRALLNLVVMF